MIKTAENHTLWGRTCLCTMLVVLAPSSFSQEMQYPTDFPATQARGSLVVFKHRATVTNRVTTFYAGIFCRGKTRITHVFVRHDRKLFPRSCPPSRRLFSPLMRMLHATEGDCGIKKCIIIIYALGSVHEKFDV